jgi:drug/metabolite transporter (DMT)-like permease
MYGAFQRLNAASIASLSFIYPLVAGMADLLLLDARLGPLQWLGMALILASLAASQSRAFIRIRPSPSGSAGSSA